MMAYQQSYSQQSYNRHSPSARVRPSYPAIATAASYPSSDSYYQPTISPMQHLPPAHILQYLSPPLPQSASPYSSSASTTTVSSRHSATSHSSHSPYSQPSPHYGQHMRPRARAVLIGINYFNQKGEMKGRTDEARNLYSYLTQIKHYHPTDIILLTDDQNGVYGQPTRKNILDAFAWLGEKAVPGERLVVYYSGHGKLASQGKKKASNGKERDGGRHGNGKGKESERMGEGETIYPVDFRSHARGMIGPEELEERLRPAQQRGAKLTVILDTHAAVS